MASGLTSTERMRAYRKTPQWRAYIKAYRSTARWKAHGAAKKRQKRLENPDHVRAIERRSKLKRRATAQGREALNTLSKNHYYENRVLSVARTRVKNALCNHTTGRAMRTRQLLGCSVDGYKAWIEAHLRPEWNWGNYGIMWEIDHIKPCASFDFSGPDKDEQLRLCFNWMNVRPLSKLENRSKGAKELV